MGISSALSNTFRCQTPQQLPLSLFCLLIIVRKVDAFHEYLAVVNLVGYCIFKPGTKDGLQHASYRVTCHNVLITL